MTLIRRTTGLVVVLLALALGATAFASTAYAYPPGHQAHITLSASRVQTGQTITIDGMNFRPKHHVVITVVCRASNAGKSYTATYGSKSSGGSFSKTITITPPFPNGTCRVFASTGKNPENSDYAKFVVRNQGHKRQHTTSSSSQVRLASASIAPGSGSDLGGLLVGGLCLAFLVGGGTLLLAGRRKFARS